MDVDAMKLDIGVIRRQEAPGARLPRTVAAVVEFAARLARRHAAEAVTLSRADLALAWRPAGDLNHFHAAPRFDVTADLTIQEHPVFVTAARMAARSRDNRRGFGEAEARALFQRLFSRETRVAPFAAPPAASATGSASSAIAGSPSLVTASPLNSATGKSLSSKVTQFLTPAAPLGERLVSGPAERVLPAPFPRRIEAAPEARAPASLRMAREQDWGTPPAMPAEPRPITLAAPEVRRVAEQVIQEIDHRIAARRERSGRR